MEKILQEISKKLDVLIQLTRQQNEIINDYDDNDDIIKIESFDDL